ncbi:hypothetical protein PINS_up003200 [Pythium insidiosum]|nr:hypothetical protein PINS_up003200 [Pythium insidiosum]
MTSDSSSGGASPLDERIFRCPEAGCLLRFKRKFTLKEHIKTHTGEKPFVCPVPSCAKMFTTSGNLARHKRLHPFLQPQRCDVAGCESSFMSEQKLAQHRKTHFRKPRGPRRCVFPGCTKQFTTTGNLTRHVKRHHMSAATSTTSLRCLSTSGSEDDGVADHKTQPARPPVSSENRHVSGEDPNSLRRRRLSVSMSVSVDPLQADEASCVSDDELLAALMCLF